MRMVSRAAVALSLVIAIVLGSTHVTQANGTNWWHSSTQPQRDHYILVRGDTYNNQWGGQCKAWIQNVVYAASGNHVWLPLNATSPNDYMWQYDPNGHVVGQMMYLEYAQLGWIVQMKLKSGIPHTAIVAGKTPTTITFLDSNWSGNEVVQYHTMTYADFYSKLAGPWTFTVYYIL